MKILIVDNYDSFTYNLLHYLQVLNEDVSVLRNDRIALAEINSYDAIVLSPGPGLPQEAGICIDLIKTYYKTKKIETLISINNCCIIKTHSYKNVRNY